MHMHAYVRNVLTYIQMYLKQPFANQTNIHLFHADLLPICQVIKTTNEGTAIIFSLFKVTYVRTYKYTKHVIDVHTVGTRVRIKELRPHILVKSISIF